jgi:hypothetical protein
MGDLAYLVEHDPVAAADELGRLQPDGQPDGEIWDAIVDSGQKHGNVIEADLLLAFGHGQGAGSRCVAPAACRQLLDQVRQELEVQVQRLAALETMLQSARPQVVGHLYDRATTAPTLSALVLVVGDILRAFDIVSASGLAGLHWRRWRHLAAEHADDRPDMAVLLFAAAERAQTIQS